MAGSRPARPSSSPSVDPAEFDGPARGGGGPVLIGSSPTAAGAGTGVRTRTAGGPIRRLPPDVPRAVASYRGAAGPADPRRGGGGRPRDIPRAMRFAIGRPRGADILERLTFGLHPVGGRAGSDRSEDGAPSYIRPRSGPL